MLVKKTLAYMLLCRCVYNFCMRLLRLKTNYFRNLSDTDVNFSPQFNFIYGDNGSGKSSLLEAIYFLSLGRSFRSTLASRAIQYDASKFNLFAVVVGDSITSLGIEKSRYGKTRIKIGNNAQLLSDLIKLLPIQLVSPTSYQLLTGGPKIRRQFIDWGVFHVEPQFFSVWQRFQQTLKQRNASLQNNYPGDQLRIWDDKFIELSSKLTGMREQYFKQLKPIVLELLESLGNLDGLSLTFFQGWDEKKQLAEQLNDSLTRDSLVGYTQYGPQRADLLVRLQDSPANEVLSRGEQKILAYALQLAQGLLLEKLTGKVCIYLFDDLFAELDDNRQTFLISLLSQLEAQVFITVIDNTLIEKIKFAMNGKIFCLQKGVLSETKMLSSVEKCHEQYDLIDETNLTTI